MSTLASVIQRGSRGSQPAASAVSIGTLYCVTDESNIVERSTGSAWQAYSPTASAGAGWALISAVTANAANHDFTGLSTYHEIMVVGSAITTSTTNVIQILVSIDNGANYLNSSGDYLSIDQSTFLGAADTTLSSSNNGGGTRYFCRTISLFNLAVPKPSWTFNGVGGSVSYIIPTLNALNAIRVRVHTGSFSTGSIAVYGR